MKKYENHKLDFATQL